MSEQVLPHYSRFRLAFDPRDKARLFRLWDEIFTSQKWTDGRYTRLFEERWAEHNGVGAVATSSWWGAASAVLSYYNLRGRKVLCPTNTFIGTAFSVLQAGAEVVFGDCRRDDLCLSCEAVEKALEEHVLSAVWLTHIGGHIAFDAPRIADLCRRRGVPLIEDCAHAHGAQWNGRKPGTFGDAGVYSFFATKTVPTGEGGMLVSRNADLLAFARKYRSYGQPERETFGGNYRMTEFTAALGLIQAERMEEFFAWKADVAARELDPLYPSRVRFPEGMRSGYYKYLVFEPIPVSSSKVYADLCHRLLKRDESHPNAEWAAANHWCVPFHVQPERGAEAREPSAVPAGSQNLT